MANVLRQLPSVDRLLQLPVVEGLVAEHGHDETVDAIRAVLDETRQHILDGASPPSLESLVEAVQTHFRAQRQGSLQPMINAAGVVIHTNMGRAPLSQATLQAMMAISGGYSNPEFDLGAGEPPCSACSCA